MMNYIIAFDDLIFRYAQSTYDYVYDRWNILIGDWRAMFSFMYIAIAFATLYHYYLEGNSGFVALAAIYFVGTIFMAIQMFIHLRIDNRLHQSGKFIALNAQASAYHSDRNSMIRVLVSWFLVLAVCAYLSDNTASNFFGMIAIVCAWSHCYAVGLFVRERDASRFEKSPNQVAPRHGLTVG